MWAWVMLAALFYLYRRKWRNRDPIFGVYQLPGFLYPFKYIIFYCLLMLRKLRRNRNPHQTADEDELEKPKQLSTHPQALDSAYFSGANSDGVYFILAMERRRDNVCFGIGYLYIPEIGMLRTPELPVTKHRLDSDQEFRGFGLHLIPEIPKRKWRIKYSGKMKRSDNPNDTVYVEIDGVWTSDLPVFNYDTGMSPYATARAFAREPWSRSFFESLKSAHQSHIEQIGTFKASCRIDEKSYEFTCPSFRDRSHGTRNWRLMHRYGFHTIFFDDGSACTVGVVCQPCTCSWLELGYMYTKKGDLYPVDWCDLQLYQHGEDGNPPKDYGFSFSSGGMTYDVQVNVLMAYDQFMGWESEARIVERFCKFLVNGIPAVGWSSWHYQKELSARAK